MTKNIFHNPPTLPKPGGKWTHAIEVPAGARTLYIAGQAGFDANGKLPISFAEQAENTYSNIVKVLEDADMSVQDLVMGTIYMVETKSNLDSLIKASARHFGKHAWAGTLIYVKSLAYPELLLEINAIAAKH
jgi:enamine deaminase RidA (YjgF/YER057c/UK114 family)